MRFNDVDLLSIHPKISISKEIPPGMPARELRTIATREGERLAGLDLQQDEYIVRVNIAAKNKPMAWEVRAALAAWAMSSGDQLALLEPTHWPGVAYDAIAKSIDPPEFVFGFAVVEVAFALPEPVAHDIMQTAAKGTTSAVLDIGGSMDTRPVITCKPAASTTGLQLTLDGKQFLAIQGEIPAGTEVQVDMSTGALLIGGEHEEKRVIYTDSNWRPGFVPGRHILSSSAESEIEARWYNRWA